MEHENLLEYKKMSWIKICSTTEVAQGSLKKFWAGVAGGIPVVAVHHKEGFVVMPPVCPHMEEPLEDSGVVSGCKLTCTKHLWAWDLQTMSLEGEAEKPLKTYDTKVEGEDVMAFITEQLEYDFEEEDDMDDDDFFNS